MLHSAFYSDPLLRPTSGCVCDAIHEVDTAISRSSVIVIVIGWFSRRARERESEMECGGEWKKKNYHEIDVVVFVLEILH